MGDRSNCSFSIPLPWVKANRTRNLRRLAKALGNRFTAADLITTLYGKKTWNSEVEAAGRKTWLVLRIEDAGGGGYDESNALAKARIPFLHAWDAGIEYGSGRGVAWDRQHVVVSTLADQIVVAVDARSQPLRVELANIRRFRHLAARVNALASVPTPQKSASSVRNPTTPE